MKNFCLVLSVLFLSGCSFFQNSNKKFSPNIERDFSNSPYIQEKVRVSVDRLRAEDPEFKALNEPSLLEALFSPSKSDTYITSKTDLFAIVDLECAAGQDVAEGMVKPESTSPSKMKYRALKLRAKSDMSLADLENVVDPDPCILGVSEDGIVKGSFESELKPAAISSIQGAYATANSNENENASAQLVLTDPGYAFPGDIPHIANIQANQAWDVFNAVVPTTSTTIIAIVDTGVYAQHEDLQTAIYRNSANQIIGFDFINNDADPNDDHYHGTHVAGLAAAVGNNGRGYSGVMYRSARIMPVKVLGSDGLGSYTAIVNGIIFAADNGAHVINLSLGGEGEVPSTLSAIQYAVSTRGSTVLMAAGNSNANIQVTPHSPAIYGNDVFGAITIGSIDASTSNKSGFSNFSNVEVELGSPGSTTRNGVVDTGLCATVPPGSIQGNPTLVYGCLAGTSMATPIAAGAAGVAHAILRARGIAVTPGIIENLLISSGTISSSLTNFFANGRRLNFFTLAQQAQNYTPPVQNVAPAFTTVPVASITVNTGAAFTLNYSASGVPTPTIQLFRNGTLIQTGTGSLSFTASGSATVAGTYFARASNAVGSVDSSSTVVTVNSGPTITQQPVSVTLNETQTATLTVSATGNPLPTYQWTFNGTAIAGATQPTLSLANINRNQSGNYAVIVTNAVASVTSNNAVINVQFVPTLMAQSQNSTVTQGSNVQLSVTVTANPAPSYQWFRMMQSGQLEAIPNATTSVLNLNSISWSQRGIYQVRASNAVGFVDSTMIRIEMSAINRAPSSIADGAMPVNEIDRTGGFRDIENAQGL